MAATLVARSLEIDKKKDEEWLGTKTYNNEFLVLKSTNYDLYKNAVRRTAKYRNKAGRIVTRPLRLHVGKSDVLKQERVFMQEQYILRRGNDVDTVCPNALSVLNRFQEVNDYPLHAEELDCLAKMIQDLDIYTLF